jgi:GNAT superfamily N-acetyltransferase
MIKQVHIWHLERTQAPEPSVTDRNYELKLASTSLPELNRMLYLAVGAPWMWYERYEWSYREWQKFLDRDDVQTWIAYDSATPVGYFELERQRAGSTEICYFGLLPEFIGKGFGRALLEDAITKAWEFANSAARKRVWLHTCTLDHPNALRNYQARGFEIFKEESIHVDLPSEPLQPWPGAGKPAPAVM